MNEDRKMALEKWGDKIEGILEQYREVDVEVEQKLGKKEMSRYVENEVEDEEVKEELVM